MIWSITATGNRPMSVLSKTTNFPEFTSRVCPALCEAACTCGLHAKPVATKENERAVIEYAYANGLVTGEDHQRYAPERRSRSSAAVRPDCLQPGTAEQTRTHA